MGDDKGIRRKHKQRTAPHQKHAVYPGMYTPKNVNVVAGSIKNVRQEPKAKVIDLSDLKRVTV